ncbi:oxidoreductase activity protein [Scheffersomyces xylosifermentans]|uniref:oxidoreductase activity protein n=1 Tax=Scheffersomyces xylosifermentans TaxID=1304137 RepID=UPI00315C8188
MSYKPSFSDLFDPLVAEKVKKSDFGGLKPENIEEIKKTIKYPEYFGTLDFNEQGKYSNVKNVDGAKNDKGHLGDASFKNLFPQNSKVKTFDLSPNFGTEIDGIQLSELSDEGKNDLALFLETRGLAVFRNQDFRDKGADFAKQFGEYFGPLHIHPTSFSAENHPELLVTFRPEGGEERYAAQFAGATNTANWHSDISFEEYPASFSFFVALEAPPSGGDTVFIDLREAYNRLSPQLQQFFETLTVIHTNYYINEFAKLKNVPARIKADYFTEHPLVRTHPVTGEKALFFSRGFIQRVKGLKPTESDAILNFLESHVTNNPEIQVRATHKGTDARTVIAWDNRFLLHSAIADFLQHKTSARHHYRITVLGEKPYLDTEKTSSNGHSNGSNGHSNGNSSNGGST